MLDCFWGINALHHLYFACVTSFLFVHVCLVLLYICVLFSLFWRFFLCLCHCCSSYFCMRFFVTINKPLFVCVVWIFGVVSTAAVVILPILFYCCYYYYYYCDYFYYYCYLLLLTAATIRRYLLLIKSVMNTKCYNSTTSGEY